MERVPGGRGEIQKDFKRVCSSSLIITVASMGLPSHTSELCLFNADCLDVLSRCNDNSFNLVYLDPPWNTGQDFVFKDKMISQEQYDEFIFKVIQQAHRILKHNGNLVLYSIPSLNINFHNLLRPIFGEKNFRAEFIIPIKIKSNIGSKVFRHSHETVICYSKSDDFQFFPLIEKSKEEINKLFPLEAPEGRFRLMPLFLQGERNFFNFSWNGFAPPSNMKWRYSKEKLDELQKEGKIYYSEDMAYPMLKVFLDDNNNTQYLDSVWADIAPYEKNKFGFKYLQSRELITRIIKFTTKKGDYICDPFAGSAISGIVANELDRKWVGIESSSHILDIACSYFKSLNIDFKVKANYQRIKVIWEDYLSYHLTASEVAKDIIRKGENERIEFKESYSHNHYNHTQDMSLPDKIMHEVAAFLNSNYGGSIFLGVKDSGEILGIESNFVHYKSKKDKFELALVSKIKDTFLGISVSQIDILFHDIDLKIICEVRIKPDKNPVFINKDFYVRIGTQCTKLKNQEFFEWLRRRKKR